MNEIINNNIADFISSIKNSPTKSSFFVRSMLGFNLSFWEDCNYLNTYITLNPDCMYLVFQKIVSHRFEYLNNTLESNSNYICTYANDNFIVYRLTIPIQFNNDFYKFLNGQYSQTSEDYKDLILRINSRTSKENYDKIKNGLYVTKAAIKELEEKLGCELAVPEVISKPNIDKESFNPKLFNLEDARI